MAKIWTVVPLGPEPSKPSDHVIGTFYKEVKNLHSTAIANHKYKP